MSRSPSQLQVGLPEESGARVPRRPAAALRGGRPVNLRDVAKAAKVSVATVSMVINDNPRISRATHLRVQKLIDRLGYRPNQLAQSLSRKHTRVMAILLPALKRGFADAYFGELISGVCDKAGKMGYKVMLEQAKPEFIKDRKHIDIFERRYVDGVLAMGVNDRHHFLEDFVDTAYPLVVCDNYFPDLKLDHVVCDYRSGAQQLMNYLLQLGHQRVGFIYAAPEVQTARDVAETYTSSLKAIGVTPNPSMTEDGKFTEQGGAAACEAILSRHPDVTAFVAGNDKMALGAIHALTRRGIEVPRQISVVGLDDLQSSAFVTPALTTVHLPLYQVGALACEKLIDRIQGTIDHVSEVLPTHLVVRESTAMVRAE